MATKSQVQEFFAWIAPYAQQAEATYGVPASVFMAQAAEESAYGTKAPGNNMFGIKAFSTWKGEKQLLWTTEHQNGKDVRVQAWFRKYSSKMDSIADRIKLMGKDLYAKARNTDPVTAAVEIQKAGYATNPNYANNLMKIANTYGLFKYDLRTGAKQLPATDLDLSFTETPSNTNSGGGGGAATPGVVNAGIMDNLKNGFIGSLGITRDWFIIILSVIAIIFGFWLIAKGEELNK